MKISNIRLGFATNSSSSHSVIILPRGIKLTDDLIYESDSYGWENFTLSSTHEKVKYFVSQLKTAISAFFDDELIVDTVLRELFGIDTCKTRPVDHQSAWAFPKTFDGRLHSQFVSDFFAFVKRDDVVILGGNDNSDGHPDKGMGKELLTPDYGCIARKDGDWWTLFNRAHGAKMRISFLPALEPYRKSTVPENVEVNITNRCGKGCAFCYQSSTPRGRMASYKNLISIANLLQRLEVFEVTLGGGEPLLYKDGDKTILDVMKLFRNRGIVPNTTTASPHLLPPAQELAGVVGNIGVTIRCVTDLAAVLSTCRIAQIPLGTITRDEFRMITTNLAKGYSSILLLGYKNTGRGKSYTPIPYDWWLEEIGKLSYGSRISVDTVLAAEYKDAILKLCPDILFSTEEGKFSCYIDAVEMRMGPSSFCDKSLLVSFDQSTFLQEYSRF